MKKNLGKHICLNDYQTFKKNTFVDVAIDDDESTNYIKVGGKKYSNSLVALKSGV